MRGKRIWTALLTLVLLCGCAAKQAQPPLEPPETPQTQLSAAPELEPAPQPQPTRRLEVDYNARAHADEAAETPEAAPAEETDAAEEPAEKSDAPAAGRVIVIDPGHQAKGNFETEALGPGSTETKIKVSSGTASCNTGEPESKLVLAISLKLRTELEARGYTVLMTRTTEDVDLSNIDRAAIANDANADALLRIHANGSESAAAEGALTICQTAASPYNARRSLRAELRPVERRARRAVRGGRLPQALRLGDGHHVRHQLEPRSGHHRGGRLHDEPRRGRAAGDGGVSGQARRRHRQRR